MNPNLPPRTVLPPHPRHRLLRVDQKTRAKKLNSVIEPWVDVAADVESINRGEAVRHGDTYTVNGRVYGCKPDGRLFPVSGAGIHQLERGAFRALGVYNRFGLSTRAERILDGMKTESGERDAARGAWQAGRPRE